MFNYLKTFLKYLSFGLILSTSQFAHADFLTGIWQHNHQQTTIRPGSGFKLLFCNEQNNCAEGFYRRTNVIEVPQWRVTGTINSAKNLIVWSNGTQWQRYNGPRHNDFAVHIGRPSLSGPWLHSGKPTSIQMYRDGFHFTLVNELGQRSEGFINGDGELHLPSLQLKGRLHRHGSMIKWNNGTTWFRP